ncbi:MAG: AAA family ATPase [Deltaproteobacteria bacterium]|nr:AAA family ATPase [Deltaproteobacteria bacterium]MBW1927574.1 AAA family ATPase [Deltaproteobacteria bacterium]MBW2024636.1 AAA family ATPase [Deltaproteobacteria bacterium]MBW2124793.1 AAA family ATPase [Deltaproteobacteria bacterium]RLB21869.1 MAG: carbon monoxide dehydrogenase [Deltaproteobacteria bacterium]
MYSVAFAGKGGTGKTTLAGLLIRYLIEKGKTPVLAVDADANANLNEVLGLEVHETLGEAREQMKKGVGSGMTKDVFMEMKVQEAIVEADGYDLLVMGRPEGAGCYCAANALLTRYLDRLVGNYNYIVMDNEAGMEHLSRLTTNNIDALVVVSDATRRGLQAASRILNLAVELKLNIKEKFVLVNLAKDGQSEGINEAAEAFGLDILGVVPEDPEIREFDLEGRPTIQLPADNKALTTAYEIFDRLMDS